MRLPTRSRLLIGGLAAGLVLAAASGLLLFGRTGGHKAAPTRSDETPTRLGHASHVHFVSELTGWKIDGNRADYMNRTAGISKTTDGGSSWSTQVQWGGDEARWAHFFSATEGVAVAYTDPWAPGGATLSVFTTRDGFTWQQTKGPQHVGWDGFTFISLTEGWAAQPLNQPDRSLTIGHTTDGGRTWSTAGILSGDGNAPEYLNLVFADQNNGWLTGTTADYKPLIWVTHDGGAHWALKRISAPSARYGVSDVLPVSSREAFFAVSPFEFGDSLLYFTSDGGDSWSRPRTLPRGGVGVLDSHQIWVGGPTLWNSPDGGRSWLNLHPDLPPPPASYIHTLTSFTDFAFFGGSRAWAILTQAEQCNDWAQRQYLHVPGWPLCGPEHRRSRQLLVATADGGRTWTQLD